MQKKSDQANSNQSARFIETARQVGADGESSAADALMGRLAKMPPDPKPKPKGPPRAKAAKRQ